MRTLHAIMAALQLAAPDFHAKLEAARHFQQLERAHAVDAFTVVAVGERESGWRLGLVGKLGELGPMQVMPSNYPSCRAEPDGHACKHIKQQLADWRWNTREAVELMAYQRAYCKRVVGSALAVHWLQEYQGYAGTCGHRKDKAGRWRALPVPKGTRDVLARRRELARRFG
jgi:hypothetical protein